MRLRPALSVLATLGFLMTVAAITPGPAFGFNGPLLAGRPIRDDGQEMQCQGVAYARVGGAIVLLTADHCRNYADSPGGAIYYHNLNTGVRTNGDVVIGSWGPGKNDGGASWANNDLAFINLFNPYVPAVGLNQVYRGAVAGNDWWTITTNPTPADGRDDYPKGGAWPDTTYQSFQVTKIANAPYRTGSVSGKLAVNDGCLLVTNLAVHAQGVDSGSPFIAFSDQTTVSGLATDQINGKLRFNSLYEGLDDINTFYVNLNGTGAWLCQSSSC